MSYSPNAVSFIKPWKVRHICPFPQRLLSGHSVQWGVLRHILRSTMTDKRLTGLALMNIHTDLEIDSEEVLKQFDATGTRAMRLGCNPLFARECECACVSLAFYLSPLNNVTYKHIGLAERNKQTNNPRGNTHFWTDAQTRFMLNQLLLLLVEVKRSSGKGCITTSCNENSATYRIGYDMLSANDSIYSLPCTL